MDFRHLLEQAQNFQRNLAQIDKDLAGYETKTSGGGGAQATVNGLGEVTALSLEAELVSSGDATLVARTVEILKR